MTGVEILATETLVHYNYNWYMFWSIGGIVFAIFVITGFFASLYYGWANLQFGIVIGVILGCILGGISGYTERTDIEYTSQYKVTLTEEQLKLKYPMDYGELTAKCKDRYSDFVLNGDYHTNRRLYEGDDKCAYTRYLDPDKKKSSKRIFYSEVMLQRLDNHYTRKK